MVIRKVVKHREFTDKETITKVKVMHKEVKGMVAKQYMVLEVLIMLDKMAA